MSVANAAAPVDQAGAADARRCRPGTGALAIALVVGLLVGFAVGVLTLRPGSPGDTSAEAGFAREMSTHHAQAVEMSMIAYERAETEQVRQLGYDIALSQQAEIGMMRQWLRDWDLLPTGSEPPMAWMPGGEQLIARPGLMPGMATAEQMTELRRAEGIEVDRLFLELMITHHLGGLHMIDGVLAAADHPEVTWLASIMKDNHHGELVVLRDLREQVAQD